MAFSRILHFKNPKTLRGNRYLISGLSILSSVNNFYECVFIAANGLDAFSGPTNYPLRSNAGRKGVYGAPGTTPRDKDSEADEDLIHPAVTSITKPLRLYQRSGCEDLKYWQNGATVQLTIIGRSV